MQEERVYRSLSLFLSAALLAQVTVPYIVPIPHLSCLSLYPQRCCSVDILHTFRLVVHPPQIYIRHPNRQHLPLCFPRRTHQRISTLGHIPTPQPGETTPAGETKCGEPGPQEGRPWWAGSSKVSLDRNRNHSDMRSRNKVGNKVGCRVPLYCRPHITMSLGKEAALQRESRRRSREARLAVRRAHG